MGSVYGIFALSLVSVALLGGITSTWGVETRALDRIGVLVAVIASLTGAGLLSLAFTVDKLVVSGINVGAFFQRPSTESAFMAVVWMLAAGTSGLLGAVALTIWDTKPARRPLGAWLRRWGSGTVAISAVAVVLLFPSVVVLIFSTHDALLVPVP